MLDKEDALTNLFRRSEPRLDEMPSADVWSRLESRLDARLAQDSHPVSAKTGGKLISFSRYLAAASVVLGIASATVLWRYMGNGETLAPGQPLAQDMQRNQTAAPIAEAKTAENDEPIPFDQADQDANFKREDSAQEMALASRQRQDRPKAIVEDRKATVEPEKLEIEEDKTPAPKLEIEISEPNYTVIPPSPTNATAATGGNVPTTTTTANDIVFSERAESARNSNYAAPPQPSSAEVLQRSNAFSQSNYSNSNNMASVESSIRLKDANVRSAKGKSSRSKASPSALHPRIQMFGWLLGRWEDKSRPDGLAIEEWTMIDPATIVCSGSRIKGSDKLFEERLTIQYDPEQGQVMLYMPTDDNEKNIRYMLIKEDSERLIFQCDIFGNYPEKIIFQREADGGYSFTMTNAKVGFTTNQQIYLSNRNHLSPLRAVRNLRPAAKPN